MFHIAWLAMAPTRTPSRREPSRMIRRRLIPTLLLLLALVAGACTTSAPDTPAAPDAFFGRSDSFVATERLGSAPESEAYLLEGVHGHWARHFGTVFGALWYSPSGTGGEVVAVDTTTWPDDHKVRVHYRCGKEAWFQFSNLHYDPEASHIAYGTTKIAQQAEADLPGHAYLYDLTTSSEEGHFEQEDAVTLEQQRSVTITSGMDFNASVTSETKVSGGSELLGASFEETLTATAGIDLKSETQKASAESKVRTENHKFDVGLPAFEATLIFLEAPQVNSYTPFTGNLVAAFASAVTLEAPCVVAYPSTEAAYDWQHGQAWLWHRGNLDATKCWGNPPTTGYPEVFRAIKRDCTLHFEDITRVQEFLAGTHERYPGMATSNQPGWPRDYHGWIDEAAPRHAKAAYYGPLVHEPARTLTITGVQHRTYEESIKETVRNVTNQDTDAVIEAHDATQCDPTEVTCGS